MVQGDSLSPTSKTYRVPTAVAQAHPSTPSPLPPGLSPGAPLSQVSSTGIPKPFSPGLRLRLQLHQGKFLGWSVSSEGSVLQSQGPCLLEGGVLQIPKRTWVLSCSWRTSHAVSPVKIQGLPEMRLLTVGPGLVSPSASWRCGHSGDRASELCPPPPRFGEGPASLFLGAEPEPEVPRGRGWPPEQGLGRAGPGGSGCGGGGRGHIWKVGAASW